MKIAKGMAVRLHVELTTSEGQVLESSDKTGPVDYVHGTGVMLPGLEKVLEGLVEGDSRGGVIPAEDAFGREDSLPTKAIARTEFPKDAKLDVGMQFEAKGPDGKPVTMKIVRVSDKEVTVRFLHPLVGKDIKFRVKVLGVKDPSKLRPPPPPAEAVELAADDIKEDQ